MTKLEKIIEEMIEYCKDGTNTVLAVDILKCCVLMDIWFLGVLTN